jgi:hypothetical protein
MADCAWMAGTGRQDHSDDARLTGSDNNLAQPNLVLYLVLEVLGGPSPSNQAAQHFPSSYRGAYLSGYLRPS